jgi:hypothetical protein
VRRACGSDQCLNQGENGKERWLGWGVIANNLMIIATALTSAPFRQTPQDTIPHWDSRQEPQ